MQKTDIQGRPAFQAGRFTLVISDERSVSLYVDGRNYADLRVVSSLPGPDGGEDDALTLKGPEITESGGVTSLVWTSESSRWRRKTYTFCCSADAITYRVTVEGEGAIESVDFFDGKEDPWGPASLYRFDTVFTSEVSLLDRRYRKSWEYSCIDGTSGQTSGIPVPPEENNHWIFIPAPLAYAWQRSGGAWVGTGLAPDPGQYNFTYFQHWPLGNQFKLRVQYDGRTHVSGTWDSPRIVFRVADDEYSAVQQCCSFLYENDLAIRPSRTQSPWWTRPIFCGWGQQNMTAVARGGSGSQYARQDIYDGFLQMLEERNVNPGTLVIDDKWQSHYGTFEVDSEKWPDLRGWIDGQHARDRKVILWFGCWTPEGLPEEECILKDGQVACVDPSNPAYEARLRAAIRRMLGAGDGCYNADGFKVDWTNGMPVGHGFKIHGNLWGIELLKRLHWIIYDEAKKTKPDALIITHAANPYFADVTDMLRLNDISAVQRGVVDIMRHRQKLALAANPDWLIDCDNSSMPTVEEWRDYMQAQPELGVPSLYFLTGVDGTGEQILPGDWENIPGLWRK